ncbi:hypothetical protein BKA93DRAFT_816502 [Sparassis latifolia]
MADITRSAKSGSDWTQNELQAYHIQVVEQDATVFLGVPALPLPSVPQEVLTTASADDMADDRNFILVRYMDLAMNPKPAQESAVIDFARHLLEMLGYAPRPRVIRTRYDIPLFICGGKNKRHLEQVDAEPQLIAGAIAAFRTMNMIRKPPPPLQSKVMAGIILTGTFPTFYKIPVTVELVDAVGLGIYPAEETVIFTHTPRVPRLNRRYSEGMKPLDNRALILSCYEAFKAFVN